MKVLEGDHGWTMTAHREVEQLGLSRLAEGCLAAEAPRVARGAGTRGHAQTFCEI